jgi:hypothetical protein
MLRNFSIAFAIAYASTAFAETPKKALVLVDQTLDKPEWTASNDGLSFKLQARDNCKTKLGKKWIPVKCSEWLPLQPNQEARDLVFHGVSSEEDEGKVRRLRKRVGTVTAKDTTTVSLRMLSPFNHIDSWELAHQSAVSGRWLLSAEAIGRLIAKEQSLSLNSETQANTKPPAWRFELTVRSEQHGDLKFQGGGTSLYLSASAKKRNQVQPTWECAGAASLNDGSLGTLAADSGALLAPQAVLGIAAGVAKTCPDVSAELTAASCPVLNELAVDFDWRRVSGQARDDLRGIAPTLLKACTPEQTLSMHQAMGKYLIGLLAGSDSSEVDAQLLAHSSARDFMTTWGSLLSEQTVLEPGLTALESLTTLLHAQHDKLISAKQFGQARVVARSLRGYTAEWDTSALTSLDTALEKHLAEQLPGKTTEEVNALFESLETALASTGESLLRPPYKRVVQTLTDAAMEAKDFEVLAQLSGVHAQQMGSEWTETHVRLSTDLRLAKAQDDLKAAIEKLNLTDIQQIDETNRVALEHRDWKELIASSRATVIGGLVDTATVAEDFTNLDTLIEIHAAEMESIWEQETRVVSTDLRLAKAKADMDTAFAKVDLGAMDTVRKEHGDILGEEWLNEVNKILSQLIHTEFESRLARGLIKYTREWVETHAERLIQGELEILRRRMTTLEAGDPTDLIPGVKQQIQEAGAALVAAVGPDSPFAKEQTELTQGHTAQSAFESDKQYLQRLAKLERKMIGLRIKHLKEPLRKLSVARNRTLTTRKFTVALSQSNYDANSRQWKFVVTHNGFRREALNVSLYMATDKAQTLYQNKDKIEVVGTLVLDLNGKPTLVSALLSEKKSATSWAWTAPAVIMQAADTDTLLSPRAVLDVAKGRNRRFNESKSAIYEVLFPSLPKTIPVKYLLRHSSCGDNQTGVSLQDPTGTFNQRLLGGSDCAAVVPGGRYVVAAENTSERVSTGRDYRGRVRYTTKYTGQLSRFSLTSGGEKRSANLDVITSNPWSDKYRRLTKIRSVASLPDGSGIVVLGDWERATSGSGGVAFYGSFREAHILQSTNLRERRRIDLGGVYNAILADISVDSRYLVFRSANGTTAKVIPTQGRRDGRVEGCYVTEVKRRTHASALGLRKGDILEPGKPCYTVANLIQRAQSGERLTLKFKRSGTLYKRTLKLKAAQSLGLQAEDRRAVDFNLRNGRKLKKATFSADNSTLELDFTDSKTREERWTGLGDYAF